MTSTKDVSVFQSRKSDIFSPSLKESGQLPVDSKASGITSRSPDLKKDHKKRRELSAANEFDQLHSPLVPGKTHRGPQTQIEDLTSSINSSTRTLITKKHRFHISKIAIIITMLLQMITFGIQLYFFGVFIAYVNNEDDCLREHIFGWVMVVFGALGLLLGFWGILSIGVQRFSRYTRRTVIIRTSIVVLYLITIIVLVAIFQYDAPLPRCIEDQSKAGFLPYVLMWTIPLATLILALIGALLSWKLIRDAKKINDLERTEQEKEELFSKVAKDLEEP